ncbi:MAG: TonB-dependent receptor plug domain-containing protein [Bacteroidota bacterium]
MKLWTCILLAGMTCSSVAQDSLHSRVLDEVVVTGQYESQSLRKSVYQVRVITSERIQSQGSTRLQDVLSNELNIRFSQDLALGGSNLSMQGLSGQNVKVLLDGVPITGRQGTGNEININQTNINSVDRIEIVEGPMAVTYGADALAGVINIITKKPDDEKLSAYAKIHEETVGGEYGIARGIHNQAAGFNGIVRSFQFGADAGRNDFNGWQGDAVGRDKMWHPKMQWFGNMMAGFKNEKINTYYRLDALQETIKNPEPFINGEAFDQQYITKRLMHQVQTQARLNDKLHVNGIVSYTDYSRRTRSTIVNETTGDERLALGDGLQDVTRFNGTVLRGTAVYDVSANLSVQPGFDINMERGSGGRIKSGEQHINDYAFFISSELSVSRLSIRPGLRAIYNSVYQAPPVVPSLNVKIQLHDNLDWRAAYGRGFRAPSLRELYFNFFDASHAIEGNVDLEAELSHSFNTSVTWKAFQSSAVVASMAAGVFYNDLDNMITTGFREGNTSVTSYINLDRYKTKGLTLTNKITLKDLEASAGFSCTGRYNRFTEQDQSLPDFTWSPELNASAGYDFKKIGTKLSFYYKYTGSLPAYELATSNGQETIRLAKMADYHWADVSVGKHVGKFITITGGVRNLLNVKQVNSTSLAAGSHNPAGPRPVGYGRSYFLSLNFQWKK